MTMEFNRLWPRFFALVSFVTVKIKWYSRPRLYRGSMFHQSASIQMSVYIRSFYKHSIHKLHMFWKTVDSFLTDFTITWSSRDYSLLFAHTSEQSWTSFGNINIQLNIVLRILRAFLISFSKCSKNHLLWNSTNS